MTTKKIEEKGQRILCDYFAECDRVDTYIPCNDKEPLWDGHLYLFSSSEQKADQVYGRIPTQLKSSAKASSKNTYNFPVRVTALESYKRDGGLAFFYVLTENPIGSQIFYCLLTPVVIKKYLRVPAKGGKISITLHQLPTDKNTVTEELFQFHFDCKKQTSSSEKPIVEIQDYFGKSGKRQFTVFAKSPDPVDNVFKHMQSHPLYLYATDDDKNVTYAIGDGPVTLKIGKNIEQNVSVNGTPYFKGCTIFEDEGETIVKIGNFFTFRSGNKDKQASLNFKLEKQSNIKKIPYLSFCLDLIKHNKFSIGKLEIPCEGLHADNELVERMKVELKILSQVRSLFSTMHIEGDINLDELDTNALSNLEALYKGIVLNEPLDLKTGMEKNVRIEIGHLVLYVMFEPMVDGRFLVRDFFMDDDVCCLLTENDVTTKSSRFTLLSVDQYVEVSNFDYSRMIPSYEQFVGQDEKVAQQANLDMLRMILAYDKTGGKKTKLLDAAEVLNNWFIETNRFCDLPINELNRLQIIKRRRILSEDENNRVCEILEGGYPEDFKTACMLLLDNQPGAEYHYAKIPEDQKDFFRSLPIYHFWKQ